MATTPTTKPRSLPTFPDSARWLLVFLLAALAVVKLTHGFERLLVWPTDGAIDLKLRYDETRAWFAGYWIKGAVYPPASQTLLWPAVGWLSFQSARGLWALLTLGCLGWLSALCARECGLRSITGRLTCALVPLAMSSTSSAVSIGQLSPIFLPVVVTAVLWMARGPSRWPDSLAAAVLFTIASVKPTLFAPFAWLVLLLPRSPRPAILSAAFYLTLTVIALAALLPTKSGKQGRLDDSVMAKLETALETKVGWATAAKPLDGDRTKLFGGGYGNLQNMSQNAGLVGLENFVLPIASVLACGAWLVRRRRTDPWILLGVCALAARLGWYHRIYDDMLLLLPMIALLRIASAPRARGVDPRTARTAAVLLGATALQALSPAGASIRFYSLLSTATFWVWILDVALLARVAPLFEGAGGDAPDRGDEVATSGFAPLAGLGAT